MTILRGDCVEVMAGMEPDSVDAICTDPPYGLEFMGKEWDRLDAGLPQENVWKGRRGQGGSAIREDDSKPSSRHHVSYAAPRAGFKRCTACGKRAFSGSPCECPEPVWVVEYPSGPPSNMVRMERWHAQWATAALRVARPGAYMLAFGGTRTVHRMTCALEDAGWVIRDMLMWVYLTGFPKSRASLKPGYEPIVLARKPGASRDLNIDASRIEATDKATPPVGHSRGFGPSYAGDDYSRAMARTEDKHPNGRWPANVVLTDDVFGGGVDGVVGGGDSTTNPGTMRQDASGTNWFGPDRKAGTPLSSGDSGSKSRIFLVAKAPRSERVLSDGRRSPHPTQKPEALIRHLVRLITPDGGLVLDPFLGSGTLGVVADGLGYRWVGIEREPEYADWAEDRVRDIRPEWEAVPA